MGQKYSDEDLVNAVEQAAAAVGEPISQQEYREWRKRVDGEYPSLKTIRNRLGWQGACDKAGVEQNSKRRLM